MNEIQRASESILPGNSDMARRMRAFDWSATGLGPIDRWPQSLRTPVATCLECAFPFVLWWGPDLVTLYNDEYRSVLGAKHPSALGDRARNVWWEIWDVIGPMLARVMRHGESTRSRDLLLVMERHGYTEECYFSFSYSPIYDGHGRVGGVLCPVIETTDRVIGERRLRTLRDLAARCQGAATEESACRAAAKALADNPRDVPFAMIYLVDAEREAARMAASAGITPDATVAPAVVALGPDPDGPWSLGPVAHSGRAAILTDLADRFDELPTGEWPDPPHTAMVLPVSLPGQELPRAILVAAVSPRRALDTDYRTFLELVATQLEMGLADARALEEERRRAEALAAIDRAKTAFFSNVSHEFRTPLTLMLAPLEDALADAREPLPDTQRDRLTVVRRNGHRLLKLVNALLDFSRLEAGRAQAAYEAVDLPALTAELASNFQSACERAGLSLVIECTGWDADAEGAAWVDREMWEKVVLNLLSNAFKFTFQGAITVTLRAVDGHAELSVSDTGVGIPAEAVPRLFGRFYRVESSRGRTYEGSGMGLSLVRELVRLHGGHVHVSSALGQGSTFTVSLPLGNAHLPPDRLLDDRTERSSVTGASAFVEEALRWLPGAGEAADLAAGPAKQPAAAPAPRPRVLWADDNADMRNYVRRLLEPRYDVRAVGDGEAALSVARVWPPDLVLSDIMMPRMDGVELLRRLRDDPRTRETPVILLSARAGEESRVEGFATGFR
jgi:signal transduction histidine kinase